MTLLARAVFVLLVGATFSAFFVAQRLKSAPPVVDVGRLTKFFSPNGDGRRDLNEISFSVKEADDVTVSVVDADGGQVRRLATAVPALPFRPVALAWDGRTDSGTIASDGIYRLRFALRRQGRSVVVQRAINLDTTPPRPVILSVKPPIAGPEPGAFEIRVRGAGRRAPPQFRVLRTDVSPEREVARFSGTKGSRRAVWDGQVDGQPAPPGTYIVVPFVEDRSGNIGSGPATLPPEPGSVPGKPGITVRQLSAQPPLEPVRAGERVEFGVDSRRRSYRWRVRRVGAARAVKKGSAQPGEPLVMRAPEGISGAYLLELRSGRYSTRVPFLVQAPKRARLLVVVPAITWLGLDRVDDDGDGVPNTLANGGPVKWPRVIDGDGGLPAGFESQTAPLLVFLDRARIRYDVTTDIALAGSRDPRATDREGVVLAGALRWVPRDLARRLRRYVDNGGRLASFGTETLRRGVQVGANRLRRPTQPTAGDPFGARLEPVRRARTAPEGGEPLPLSPLADDPGLRLLTGSDGTLGGFRMLEESRARPESRRAKVLVGLGQDVTDAERAQAEADGELPRAAEPALTATQLGKGIVIRVGLPDWLTRAGTDAEVAQVTRNIIDILRRVRPQIRSSQR